MIRFEDYNLVIEACVQGVGIALARPPLSDVAFAAGSLVAVCDRALDQHVSFHLIRPDGALSGPAVELARRLLSEAGHSAASIAAFTCTGQSQGILTGLQRLSEKASRLVLPGRHNRLRKTVSYTHGPLA